MLSDTRTGRGPRRPARLPSFFAVGVANSRVSSPGAAVDVARLPEFASRPPAEAACYLRRARGKSSPIELDLTRRGDKIGRTAVARLERLGSSRRFRGAPVRVPGCGRWILVAGSALSVFGPVAMQSTLLVRNNAAHAREVASPPAGLFVRSRSERRPSQPISVTAASWTPRNAASRPGAVGLCGATAAEN